MKSGEERAMENGGYRVGYLNGRSRMVRRSHGLCEYCSKPICEDSVSRCADCLAGNAAVKKRSYHALQKLGICPKCVTRSDRPGRKCSKCVADFRLKQRLTNERLKAEGKCPGCRDESDRPGFQCSACLRKHRERRYDRKATQKRAEKRAARRELNHILAAEWLRGVDEGMEYLKLGDRTLAVVSDNDSGGHRAVIFYPRYAERLFPTEQECKDWAVYQISSRGEEAARRAVAK